MPDNKFININGEEVGYDACCTCPLNEGIKFYGNAYEYIGSGWTTVINGNYRSWLEEHHFFILTDVSNLKQRKYYELRRIFKTIRPGAIPIHGQLNPCLYLR